MITSLLKYRSFDQLMSSVESDLQTYADENLIDRSKLIKEVRTVNADLGLKINKEREAVIDVREYKADLPEDFMYLQIALSCHTTHTRIPTIRGIQTEAHSVHQEDRDVPIIIKNPQNVCFNQCEGAIWVTQKQGDKVHSFQHIERLGVTSSSIPFCSEDCFNFKFRESANIINILNENEASFSFRHGKVYINYLTDMTDEDGNLLIIDHPLIRDYYEYRIKAKIFENFLANKDGDFLQIYQIMQAELRQARIKAIGIVNTPEYGEWLDIQKQNRHRFYHKYIRYFDNSNQGFFKLHR